MRRRVVAAVTVAGLLIAGSWALAQQSTIVQTDAVKWGPASPALPTGAQQSVLVGDPGEVIVSESRERGSDLIVLGDACKGRSETYKARISMKKLLRSAPCSVLQVKATAREEDAALTAEACASRLHGTDVGSAARR